MAPKIMLQLQRLYKYHYVQYNLEDDDENEEEKHVDNVKDDRLLDSNAEEQSGTDEQPVLDQQVPQPTTYTRS